jgi:dipeptidyl aminopeptidase/acylaminoacyl peptidase
LDLERAILRAVPFVVLLWLSACQPPNHYLIHPDRVPDEVFAWTEDTQHGQLQIHLEWAKPLGNGPFATVLVHPEGGKTANDMKGVIWDVAQQGYLAVAADYRRLIDDRYRRSIFAWRDDSDVTAALNIISRSVFVDPQRIATLGFSQGGVYSLMIAAHAPRRIKAVVAYYPVTDFEYWLYKDRSNPIERLVFRVMRGHFRRQSGAESEEEFRDILKRASPLPNAELIRAPVLLIHGDSDKAASAEESQRLAERLAVLNREVKLIVVPGAVHIFNFRQQDKAVLAWEATLAWLDRNLRTES